jgi:hypothetical protein
MPLRLDMLMTLFRVQHGDGEDSKTLEKMCDNIRRKLSRLRGEAVHTRWVRGEFDSPMIYAVRVRGKLEREKRGQPARKLREVAGMIANQAEELQAFLEQRQIVERTP